MKIKAMIAEDERLVREELAYLLQQEEDILLCPAAENGKQLLELHRTYQPDVIFLDIQMPLLSGMEAVKTIREEHLETNHKYPYFIFTTAYDEYAVEAFELDAVDYLLKPYDAERFRESIARLRKHMQTQPDAPSPAPVPKLLIEHHEKLVVLNPESIYYAVRSDRMIEIHTEKDTIETKMSLQELEKKLTGHPFFRPHRSFLVNLNCIREIIPWFNGAYNLILKDKQQSKIPVSRSAAKSLFERLRKS